MKTITVFYIVAALIFFIAPPASATTVPLPPEYCKDKEKEVCEEVVITCDEKEQGIFKGTDLKPPACAIDSFPQVIVVAKNVLNILLSIAAALFILFMVIAGIKYITAGDSQDRIKDAKSSMINAIIGLGVILLSYVIINTLARALGS